MNVDNLTEEQAKELLKQIFEAAKNSEDARDFNEWVTGLTTE